MDLDGRAKIHAALGDPDRLRIIDDLGLSDRSVNELANLVQMPGNLLAHHLDVLEEAGLIRRQVSEGDHRRRYVILERDLVPWLVAKDPPKIGDVFFVCTHNSARSQFAAALWHRVSDRPVQSAGTNPARRVHPLAIRVAAEFGVDLSRAAPAGYESLVGTADFVISVCDRAREAGLPQARQHLHWSVPDPVSQGTVGAFRSAFGRLSERVDRLAVATHA